RSCCTPLSSIGCQDHCVMPSCSTPQRPGKPPCKTSNAPICFLSPWTTSGTGTAITISLQVVYQALRAQGKHPYIIPVSGTTAYSCLGYVRCGLEIARQIAEEGISLDAVYVPFGTFLPINALERGKQPKTQE